MPGRRRWACQTKWIGPTRLEPWNEEVSQADADLGWKRCGPIDHGVAATPEALVEATGCVEAWICGLFAVPSVQMLDNACEFYKALGFPYRVVTICSGSLNDAAIKKWVQLSLLYFPSTSQLSTTS